MVPAIFLIFCALVACGEGVVTGSMPATPTSLPAWPIDATRMISSRVYVPRQLWPCRYHRAWCGSDRSSSNVRRSAVQDAPLGCGSSVNCLRTAVPGRHARTASSFHHRGDQACRELCRVRAASSGLIWTPLNRSSGRASAVYTFKLQTICGICVQAPKHVVATQRVLKLIKYAAKPHQGSMWAQ